MVSDSKLRKGGFTLIELLVVISIIALLVGILLPALGKARIAAQNSVDLSQQRQIAIGIHSYAADNNGYAPAMFAAEAADDCPGLWYGPPHTPNPWEAGNSGAFIAGRSLFGNMHASWNFSSQHGLGVLIPYGPKARREGGGNYAGVAYAGQYLSADIFWTPNDQKAIQYGIDGDSVQYQSMWTNRLWFGDKYEKPWTDGALPWGRYVNGANYGLESSYSYRGPDYAILPDAWDGVSIQIVFGNYNPLGGNVFNAGTAALRTGAWMDAMTEKPQFSAKSILANHGTADLDPNNLGVNAIRGDGSGAYYGDDDTVSGIDDDIIQNWFPAGYFDTRKFVAIDYYNDF